jgi:hypothetical protein
VRIALARGRVDLYAGLMLVVHTALFAAAGAVLFWLLRDVAEGVAAVFVLVAVALVWVAWTGLYVVAWLRTRKIDVPMELQPTGLVARSAVGELVVPWAAITSATVERTWSGRRLRIRLVPESDPRHADIVVAWLKPEMMRIVERQGLRYSLRGLDIGVDELRQAFLSRSGGLVHVS